MEGEGLEVPPTRLDVAEGQVGKKRKGEGPGGGVKANFFALSKDQEGVVVGEPLMESRKQVRAAAERGHLGPLPLSI